MYFTCLATVSLAARIFTFRSLLLLHERGPWQRATKQHNVACHMQNSAETVADYYFAIIVIVNNNFDLIRLDWQTLESAMGKDSTRRASTQLDSARHRIAC